MIKVPDSASIATMRWVSRITGRDVGGSTGTSMWSALRLAAEMRATGEQGSVVTLICDSGERYAGTYGSDSWLAQQGIDIEPYEKALDAFPSPVSGANLSNSASPGRAHPPTGDPE